MSTPEMNDGTPNVSEAEEIDVDDLDAAQPMESRPTGATDAFEASTSETEDGKSENIIIGDLASAKPVDLHVKKAHDAFTIAVIIVGTFSGVILVTLLIVVGILWKTGDPTRVKIFVDAVTPIYESLGKFVPPVFGSLLAFILGYYYSKEQQQKN